MHPVRTKQINVYGKRSRRIVDAPPPTENSVPDSPLAFNSPKADRVPLIHRMKKRKCENSGVAKALKSLSSPKIVGLTKQRVVSVGSPARKRRGMRVAEILVQETRSRSPDVGEGGARLSSVTPLARKPLSTLALNAALVDLQQPRKKPVPSPKSLVTTRRLSTVQMDIQVLDAKGTTLKQEKRVTRTDVIANYTSSKQHNPNGNHPKVALRETDTFQATLRNKGNSALGVAHAPLPEIVGVESSADQFSQNVSGTRSHPIDLSSVLSENDNSGDTSWKLRPTRKTRRATTRIIISDDSGSEEEEEEEDYLPPASPASPAKLPRKSVAPPARKTAPSHSVPKPSDFKVEVLVPPAPYNIRSALVPRVISSPVPQQTIPPSLYPTTYNLIPSSPPLKPRPLTPIRRRQYSSGIFAPPSPPSPTTPTDFDLSLEFSQLDIGLAPAELNPAFQVKYPEYLRPLLEECYQEECGPYEFSAFIESFPYDPLLKDAGAGEENQNFTFRKIGEASYSEVFGIGDVVLKVIPLRDESRDAHTDNGLYEEEGPAPTDAKDVRKEIIVTRAMGEVHSGFVKLLRTYIVRGKYPEVLLNLWDQYHERKGSESVRPDTFAVSQMYAIIVLPNGGPDLEAHTFPSPSKTGWRQACSVFWQVAKALAHAEQLVSFEHRDLHWGQILVKDLPMSKPAPFRTLTLNQNQRTQPTKKYMDDVAHGVQTTIIDLGLSRMDAGDGDGGDRVQWTPFDEEVFMGEGDYQFDVYRIMRAHTNGDWEAFHPLTNVMWLHYLVVKLLRHKNVKAPSPARKPRLGKEDATPFPSTTNASSTSFTEKDCYDCLVDVEDWLGRCIAELTPRVSKPRPRGQPRKTVTTTQIKAGAAVAGPARAGEVVAYAVKRGWVRSTS